MPRSEADFDFDFDDAVAASVASELKDADQSEPVVAEAHETVAVASDDADDDLDIDAELDAAMADVDFEPAADGHGLEAASPFADEEVLEASKADEEHQDAEIDQYLADAVDAHLDQENLQPDAADHGAAADEESLDDLLPEADEFRLDPADLHLDADDLTMEEAEPVQAGGHLASDVAPADDYDIGLHASDFDLDVSDARAQEQDFDLEEPAAVHEDELGSDEDYAISDQEFESDLELSVDESDLIEDAADYEAASDDQYYDSEPQPREDAARPASPMDIAAAEYHGRDAAPLNLASAFNLEAELNALLGNKTVAKAEPEATVSSSRSYEPQPSVGGDDDLAWELEDLVEAAASAESELDMEAQSEAEYADESSYEPEPTRGFGPDRSPAPAYEEPRRFLGRRRGFVGTARCSGVAWQHVFQSDGIFRSVPATRRGRWGRLSWRQRNRPLVCTI